MSKSKVPKSTNQPEDQDQSGNNFSANIEVEQLSRQVIELTNALKRERADATNIRRQHEEQVSNLRSAVKVGVVEELLPVIDNFERAIKHVPKELETNDYIRGVQGVVKQFESTLSNMGVARVKTVGEHFNPHLHEAVGVDDGKGDKEIVSEELQAGYQLGDQVIRPAMVRVQRV